MSSPPSNPPLTLQWNQPLTWNLPLVNRSLPKEFGITPLRGYRCWAIKDNRRLSSTNFVMPWEPGKPVEASCQRCGNPPSTWHCGVIGRGCGIYAWHRPEYLDSIARFSPYRVWGVVEGWGRVVWHENGWRAQFGRMVALAESDRGVSLAEIYGVPCMSYTSLITAFPPTEPWKPIPR